MIINMKARNVHPTFEGVGIFLISAFMLWYALTSMNPDGNAYMIVIGGSILGVIAAIGDFLDYFDMSDYVDFSNIDGESQKSAKSNKSKKKKTPPAPTALKNKLYYERAGGACEHCGERVDQPHVHHIKPRADGGPNTVSNLIVLCPNCHSKADSGLIARHRLRYKAKQQNDAMDEKIK